MPVFEYYCKKCEHITAFLEKAGARKAHACEKCGSEDTRKVFSTFAAKTGGSSDRSSCPTGTCPLS
jgi:putative FmdB family regulatory protein